MKKYIKLFEEFSMGGVLPAWAKPNAPVGGIGHAAVSHSLGEYQDPEQSMTKFSIGDKVRCIDPAMASYGKIGSIVAFEDATVRWKVDGTDTTVGVDALEYRCYPHHLQKIVLEEIVVVSTPASTQVDPGTNQTDVATQ